MPQDIALLIEAQRTMDRFAEARLLPVVLNSMFPQRPVSGSTAGTYMQRFLRKIAFGMSDCWYWRGYRDDLGYGVVSYMGEHRAHRVAYRLFHGPIPDGMKILHRCDVRSCVNPDHLFVGTQADNVADMVAKGRGRNIPQHGEANPMAVLTAESVRKIRQDFASGSATQRQMAKRYGVGVMTINRAIRRASWKTV